MPKPIDNKYTRRFLKNKISVRMEGGGDESENKKTTVEGYAAVFNSWSEDLGWFREKISVGAFDTALQTSDVRALYNHDPNHLLGREKSGTLILSVDATGLKYTLALPEHRHDIVELIERGDLAENSFAFTIANDEWVENPDGTTERLIHEVKGIRDIALVTYPAYAETSLALRSFNEWKEVDAEPDEQMKREQEQRERSLSLSEASLSL